MTPRDILDSDNVVRYVKKRHFQGQKVNADVFRRRVNEDGLSVNLLDRDDSQSKEQQVSKVRKLIHLQHKRGDMFAELNVGDIKEFLRDELPNISFVHKPSPASSRYPKPDSTHSEILGLPPAEDKDRSLTIADMIAKRVKTLHPARP